MLFFWSWNQWKHWYQAGYIVCRYKYTIKTFYNQFFIISSDFTTIFDTCFVILANILSTSPLFVSFTIFVHTLNSSLKDSIYGFFLLPRTSQNSIHTTAFDCLIPSSVYIKTAKIGYSKKGIFLSALPPLMDL